MSKLTGNAIVGQSGGPTAAINATLSGVIRGCFTAHKDGTVGTLYGMRNGIDGLVNGKYIDLTGIWNDEEKLSLLENTPAAALGSCRKKLPDPMGNDPVYAELFELFEKKLAEDNGDLTRASVDLAKEWRLDRVRISIPAK